MKSEVRLVRIGKEIALELFDCLFLGLSYLIRLLSLQIVLLDSENLRGKKQAFKFYVEKISHIPFEALIIVKIF